MFLITVNNNNNWHVRKYLSFRKERMLPKKADIFMFLLYIKKAENAMTNIETVIFIIKTKTKPIYKKKYLI